LTHPHQEVRLNFARILAEIQGPDCYDKLEQLMIEEDDDLVRQELQLLLVGLKQDNN